MDLTLSLKTVTVMEIVMRDDGENCDKDKRETESPEKAAWFDED